MKLMRMLGVVMAMAGTMAVWGQEPAGVDVPIAVGRGSLFLQVEAAAPSVEADGGNGNGMVNSASWIAVPEQKPRKYKKRDLVTVIVREDSASTTSGKSDSKKQQDFDVALKQFLELDRFSGGVQQIGNVSNPSKLPEISFKYNNDRKSDASKTRSDLQTWRIQAEVVDVKPNGTLVLEAMKELKNDGELQRFRLTGVCRAEDLTPDNTILSTQLANLSLAKETKGEVRDGTKRGWLNWAIDKASPF